MYALKWIVYRHIVLTWKAIELKITRSILRGNLALYER